MPIWLRIILAAFTVYRVTDFIILDDGPFDLMFTIRDKLGRYDLSCENNLPVTGIGRFLACFHCVAKWVAIPAGLAVLFPAVWSDAILIILGLAGFTSAMYLKFKRPR